MATGLLVWVPLIITVWVTWVVVSKFGFGLEHLIKRLFNAAKLYYLPGMGFLIAVALFLGTGFLARYYVGVKLISFGEKILHRIPLISKIYKTVQQIRDVFVGQGTVFRHVCLIEYPRPGVWAVAFVTSEEQGSVQETLGYEAVAVFVPTTPNPTSGYLVYVPRDKIIKLNISIEEAMKIILSGGAYVSWHDGASALIEKFAPKE